MSDANKEIARRYIEEIWTRGNLEVADEVFAADILNHVLPPGLPEGREGMKAIVAYARSAFPNLKLMVEDIISEGDRVACRWTSLGTHEGELWDIPASGNQVAMTGVTIFRVANGVAVEHWVNSDDLGMMQQIGAVPGAE
jgi:steroid delta-isomerase-like uncharacterized protein